MAGRNTYRGSFTPTNLEKYKGDPRKITYRSSWESHIMKFCDTNKHVVRWNSECVVVPYFSQADGKKRRYFVDFWVQFENGETHLWEVKPLKETYPPPKPTSNNVHAKKKFVDALYLYSVNIDKWKAAHALSKQKGWQFKIITEKTLKSVFGWKG
ncbi:head completion protein [Pectobacterium phage POP12]|nr:head completion protein [Pectobacterium phage POP12]